MSRPLFVVPVADLERGPRTYTWPIPEAWLRTALAETEAIAQNGPGTVELELSKNGREVLVRGFAQAELTMTCAITGDPIQITVKPEIFLMLRQIEGEAARRGSPRPSTKKAATTPSAAAAKAPPAHKTRKKTWAEEPELAPEDAASDTFQGHEIVLDPFVREFILLELPMIPRRSDLPLGDLPAIAQPAVEQQNGAAHSIDPRLLPLAELANRMRVEKE